MAKTSESVTQPDKAIYRHTLEQYSRRLEILHETALLINQVDTEERVYRLLLEQLRSVMRFDSATVLLVEDGCLKVVASNGFPPEMVTFGICIPIDANTPSQQVVGQCEAILVDNMHESYPNFALNSPDISQRIASWLGVPLTWQGKTIGEISLDRWVIEPFTQDDLRLTTIIANHAAGAIERIRLHRQVSENNEQLELRVAQRTAEIERAQTAIRNLVERLELATRIAGIGVWEWDLANQAVYLDQNTRRLFKLPPSESDDAYQVFQHWLDYVHPDDRLRLEAEIADAIDNHQVYDSRYRIRLPDGSYRHMHTVASVFLGPDKSLQRVIGVSSDITKDQKAEAQRIKTQENLRQSEEHLRLINAELERTSRLKDEFLANMSHELRTPLNAILILSESLQEEVYGPINNQQRQALTDVVNSGQHLLSLINDILDLSKIEAGKLELQYNPVSVPTVCQSSLRLVRELAIKRRQSIELQLAVDAGLLWADERRLRQMLVNLLTNAVKFTPEEGRIGLDVAVSEDGAEISFSVWDTGIGIADDRLPRLFQPFAQLDSALNRQYGGTGLGLALVRRLAEMHGGRVEVQSKIQAGTRFTIVLPNPPIAADHETETADQEYAR